MIRYNLYRYWWMVFPWKGFSIATFDCGRVLGIHFQETQAFPTAWEAILGVSQNWDTPYNQFSSMTETSSMFWTETERSPVKQIFFLQKPFHDFDRAKVQSQRHRFRIVSHGQLLGTSLADAGGCWSSKRVPEVCCILQLFFNKPIKNYV